MAKPSNKELKWATQLLAEQFNLELKYSDAGSLPRLDTRYGMDKNVVTLGELRSTKADFNSRLSDATNRLDALETRLTQFMSAIDVDIDGLHEFLGIDWNTNVAHKQPKLVVVKEKK